MPAADRLLLASPGSLVGPTLCGTPKPSAMLRLGKEKRGSGSRVLFCFFFESDSWSKGAFCYVSSFLFSFPVLTLHVESAVES